MKKNVSGQKVGAQMVTAADGTAFSGSVTVYVTGDAGTQAIGSVGSGACTSEGNGYFTYAPAQAETNYDLVAFTFIGTGAIPATVQAYTNFPQSVDNATNISAIKTKTDFLPSATAGGTGGVFIAGTNAATTITTALTTTFTGSLTGSVASVSGAVGSVTGAVGSVTGAVGSVTGNVGGNVNGNVVGSVGSVPATVATAAALTTVGNNVTSVKAKTDSLTFSTAGQVDANIQYVNDTAVTGDGSEATPWGPV